MKTSLKDIAEKTNLSITTVSRVLNGKAEKYRISKQSQDLIFSVAEKMNYIPNLTAVNLQSGKTRTIALIIPSLVNPFFANIAGQIATEIQSKGYISLISDSNESIKIEKEELNNVISRNVDGIIIGSAGKLGDHIVEIQKRGIPVVCIDRYFDNLDVHCVATDNYLGGYLAAKHLIENGHSGIACIQGIEHSTPNRLRIKGFKAAMKETENGNYSVTGSDFTVQNGYTETLLLLQEKQRPTAIFTLSNTIALGAIKALREKKVKIPEEISLITFDDHPYLEYLATPLTCIAQPTKDICRIAIRLLFSEMNNKSTETKRVFLKPEIVIRNSVKRIDSPTKL